MKKHFFAFSLIACAVGVTLPTQALAVKLYGAGSLRDSLTEVAESFNEKYGIPVETRFGPSGLTREFIEQEFSETGKSADVFASADIDNPQTLFEEGLSEPVVNFTSNRMTAVVRSGLGITSDNLLDFLLKPEIKLGTSTPIADPSGNYAWQIFDKANQVTPGNSQILKNKALQLVGGNPNAPIVPNALLLLRKKKIFVGWVEHSCYPTKPEIVGVGFRSSTQPTPKFIKVLKNKGG